MLPITSIQADELMKKAKSSTTKFSLFNVFSDYTSNTEYAIELYERAGNLYKMSKDLSSAAKAFIAAGDLNIKLEQYLAAGYNYHYAGQCLNRLDMSGGPWFHRAADRFIEAGQFIRAADTLTELADSEYVNRDEAYSIYLKILDIYETDERPVLINPIREKLAEYLILSKDDFIGAVQYYQQIVISSADSPILSSKAQSSEAKIILCYLANDDLTQAKKMFEYYAEIDLSFSSFRNGKFCASVIEAFEKYDVDLFTKVVSDYDQITRLDKIQTRLLSRAKYHIKNTEENLA